MYNNELYRILIKKDGQTKYNFTGRKSNSEIIIESDISKQAFYYREDALMIKASLNEVGIDCKVIKANFTIEQLAS